jgi:hypothetical protein
MTSHYCRTGLLLAVILMLGGYYVLAGSASGLVAYYPLNGDGVDASGNGHDGMVEYATSAANRFGQYGKALLFDGTNSFISVPDSRDLRLSTGDFTISAWIFETSRNSNFNDCIISKRGPGGGPEKAGEGQHGWFLSVRGETLGGGQPGELHYQESGGGIAPRVFSKTLITLNQWHHVAVVYHQDSTSLDMFVDGAWDAATNNMPHPNPACSFDMHIGNDSQLAYSNAYVFHGKISDVRIYNYAMTAQDIAGLYETGIFLNGMEFTGGALTRLYGGLAAGQEVVVESSPDLSHWTPIETNIVSSSTLSLTNYVNPKVTAEFFRVSVR